MQRRSKGVAQGVRGSLGGLREATLGDRGDLLGGQRRLERRDLLDRGVDASVLGRVALLAGPEAPIWTTITQKVRLSA